MRPSTQRLLGLGALAVVVAVGGALFLFGRSDTEAPPPQPVAKAVQAPRGPTFRQPIDVDGEPAMPSEEASERAMRLVGQARRLADSGKFEEARARLDEADKAVPGLGETAEARRRITEMSTPEGQFSVQLERAVAIDDAATAEKALDEAERLRPQAPEIAALRQSLEAARKKEADRHRRIVELIASMRQAIARGDFAAADGALNEASRIDVLDPMVDRARSELAHAHEASR